MVFKKARFDGCSAVCFVTSHSNPNSLSSYSLSDGGTEKKTTIALDVQGTASACLELTSTTTVYVVEPMSELETTLVKHQQLFPRPKDEKDLLSTLQTVA